MSKKRKRSSNTACRRQPYTNPNDKKVLKKLKTQPQSKESSLSPFNSSDTVLLVGEGDFSFANALCAHAIYSPLELTATSYDSHDLTIQKYPQAERHITKLISAGGAVHHNIDATKLNGYRELRKKKYSKIAFLFPHVGGLTKDVDRQIRANQVLLMGFFKCLQKAKQGGMLQVGGRVVVTLFEGGPYEDWDITGIANGMGFFMEQSYTWDWNIWVGYNHVRTLGNLEGKGNGWQGRNRNARCYVLGIVGQEKTGLL